MSPGVPEKKSAGVLEGKFSRQLLLKKTMKKQAERSASSSLPILRSC
jgi:hypothetical protein